MFHSHSIIRKKVRHEFLKNGFIKRIENERTEEIGSMISYSKDGE